MNNRLVKWASGNNIIVEAQAGFRKGYCTTDQIFCLQSLVQKYLSVQGGRLYVIFIDFSKAFDRVNHNMLWHRLISYGIHGNALKVLRSMYSQSKSCIRCKEGLTEYFNCDIGTRQGCMLSPFLFSLFINE